MPDELPARAASGVAVFCKEDTEGVQEDLAGSAQHSALSTQPRCSYVKDKNPLKRQRGEGRFAQDNRSKVYGRTRMLF
jgi:hypothetical protein